MPLNKSQQRYVARMNRIRRVQLDEWEMSAPNLCWLAIWMAYREKVIVSKLPTPQLSQEWDDLRKWARQYVKRHTHTSKSNLYHSLSTMHSDLVTETVHCIDDPLSPANS